MDFSKLMQEANKMQRQMQQAQKELEETLFEVESSGGAIKISIYGNYHVEKIDIDEDLIKDFASIIHCFCARLYGLRRSQNMKNKINKVIEENVVS